MDLKLSEVFCELGTGFSLIMAIIVLMVGIGCIQANEIAKYIASLAIEKVTLLCIISYVIGIIFDAILMSLDNVIIKIFDLKPPNNIEQKLFWEKVESHVLKYRDSLWAYSYFYLNLFILVSVSAIGFDIWAIRIGMIPYIILIHIAHVIVSNVLLMASKNLLKLYYEIGKGYQ